MHRSMLVSISLGLLLAGCDAGAPSEDGGDSTVPVALSAACRVVDEAVCRRWVGCGYFGTDALDFCVEESFACRDLAVERRVQAGTIGYDGAALRRCAGKLERMPCTRDGWDDLLAIDADCRDALRGLVPVGGECDDDLVCASGRCNGDECPSRCIASGESGAACTPGESTCAPHLGCRDGVCGGLPVAGERCTQDRDPEGMDMDGRCGPGLFCTLAGTCRAYAGPGEPCSDDPEWEGGVPCDLRFRCEDGTCVARGQTGAPCWRTSECAFELYCADGTCAPRIPAGASCVGGWEAHERCAPWLYCLSTGVCGRPLPHGSPCAEEFDDCAGWCEAGTCAEEVGPGEVCDDVTWFCSSGPCVEHVCVAQACGEW